MRRGRAIERTLDAVRDRPMFALVIAAAVLAALALVARAQAGGLVSTPRPMRAAVRIETMMRDFREMTPKYREPFSGPPVLLHEKARNPLWRNRNRQDRWPGTNSSWNESSLRGFYTSIRP